MAAQAGEKARKTGTFVCRDCNERVRVRRGQVIPECPNGHSAFEERIDERAGERSAKVTKRRRTRTSGATARRAAGRKTSGRKTAARSGRTTERKAARRSKSSPRRKTTSRRKPASRKRRTQR